MSKKTEIKAADEAQLPAFLKDLPDNAGFEEADADSYAIPFLAAIQKGSPICDETAAEYNPDARPGELMNSVTLQRFDGKEGVEFIPASYRRRFIKWNPRGSHNAGFAGEYTVQEIDEMVRSGTIAKLDNKLFEPLPDGRIDPKLCPIYKDTRLHFGLLVVPGQAPQQVLLSLTSTQIKKSKALMAMLRLRQTPDGKTLPTFASVVRIKTVPESNDEGSWYGYQFTIERYATEAEYLAGMEFHKAVVADEAKVNYDAGEAAASPSSSSPQQAAGF